MTDEFGEAPSGLWLPWDAMPPVDLGAEVKAGGADRNRGNAEQLRRYWTHGEGAAKIRWGEPGDFKRCVRAVEKHMPGRAEGYCANRHKEALGVWPGQEHGKALDETNEEVQDILLAEDAAMKEWLADHERTELKVFNLGAIFEVAGWSRRLAKDALGWFTRIQDDFGQRQQVKLREQYQQILSQGDDAPADLPADSGFIDFDIELPQVQDAIHQQVNRLSGVNDVTFARIADTLAEGEAAGETMPQLADRVKQVFATSKARALAIARTEVTTAANSAQQESARLNGAKTKTWIAAHDDRTRPSHVAIDRHTVDIDDHYPVPYPFVKGVPAGIVPMEHPGDPQAPPGLTVNCRCTSAYGFGLKYPGAVESATWFADHGIT